MKGKAVWHRGMCRPESRFFCIVLITFLFVSPFLYSCTTMGEKARGSEKDLVKSTEAFNVALRWNDFKSASCWIPPTCKESFWQFAEAMQNKLRITDFEVRDVSVDGTGTAGTAIVLYKYYYTHSPCLQTRTVSLRWTHTEKSKIWQLDTAPLLTLMP